MSKPTATPAAKPARRKPAAPKPHPLAGTLLVVRALSQDAHEVAAVMQRNAYQLPDKFQPKDLILDVGANIGTFAVSCLARGAGRVLCYEPDADNCRLLAKNLAAYDDRAAYVRAAVWKAGVKTVRLFGRGVLTSMHLVAEHPDQLPATAPLTAVDALSLDDLLRPHKRVRLLKLDCEGAEWPALYDAEPILLARCKEVVAELHPTVPVEGYDCTPKALVAHLRRRGWRCETWADEGGVNVMLRATPKE